MKTLVVIPARGGSKGIPRKSLRPLGGKPMIYYAINAALQARSVDEVVVTTDDDEIALFASRFGAMVVKRPDRLANDVATLDPVIVHAVDVVESESGKTFDLVVTVQPTSPLVKSEDIDSALCLFDEPGVDTVLSVVDDRHLCWGVDGIKAVPRYLKRVNRQQLPANYKETGAIIACRRKQLKSGTRIGQNVALHEISHERSFDIDTFADLYLCEAMLTRSRLVFTVIGRPELGMGHAYRIALLAHELVRHELIIVCEAEDQLAYDYLSKLNYQILMVEKGKLLDRVIELQPALVVNDILDTDFEYIKALKSAGIRVVNFEDMGPGSAEADLVINALYSHQVSSGQHLVGPRYFCLRDEFLHLPEMPKKERMERVLLTFGGTDENNLSVKTLLSILPVCVAEDIEIDIVVGPGYPHTETLAAEVLASGFNKISYSSSVSNISDHMINADVAITSGGRTVFELAAIGVPTIVVCQNERETEHSFASNENGIINLGLCDQVSEQLIADTFAKVLQDNEFRQTLLAKIKAIDLSGGKARVIGEINGLLSGVRR